MDMSTDGYEKVILDVFIDFKGALQTTCDEQKACQSFLRHVFLERIIGGLLQRDTVAESHWEQICRIMFIWERV